MDYQIERNMKDMEIDEVPIFSRAPGIKSQPIARQFDQAAEQESPFRPRGDSREGFRRGHGSGRHRLHLILSADSNAVAQGDQNRIEFLGRVDKPVELLTAQSLNGIWHPKP